MTISLKAGWNEVLYPGITQSVEAAFASILPYLEAVYYWTGEDWVIPTTLVTGNYYSINVSQDCEWTFEVFEPPYTEITDIVAPSSAIAGEAVPVYQQELLLLYRGQSPY
ncbi:unnamed protein product [marine sediment metagenome]|uniref:Uncharacterized protein n=1 Tax=marine sediment metagenome TaxID=412755 RepID=X1TF06_9ZZZZ